MSKKCDIAYEIVKGMVSVYNDWNNFNELRGEAWHYELRIIDMRNLLDDIQGYYLSSISVKKEVDRRMTDWGYLSTIALQEYNKECRRNVEHALFNSHILDSQDCSELKDKLKVFRNNPSKRNFRHLYKCIWETIALMEKKKKEYDERLKIVAEQKKLWETLHDQIKNCCEGEKE